MHQTRSHDCQGIYKSLSLHGMLWCIFVSSACFFSQISYTARMDNTTSPFERNPSKECSFIATPVGQETVTEEGTRVCRISGVCARRGSIGCAETEQKDRFRAKSAIRKSMPHATHADTASSITSDRQEMCIQRRAKLN